MRPLQPELGEREQGHETIVLVRGPNGQAKDQGAARQLWASGCSCCVQLWDTDLSRC